MVFWDGVNVFCCNADINLEGQEGILVCWIVSPKKCLPEIGICVLICNRFLLRELSLGSHLNLIRGFFVRERRRRLGHGNREETQGR